MKLKQNELFLLTQCAISAALEAGQIITQYTKKKVAVKTKKGGASLASQVVTEVDHLSQDIILKTLNSTCEQFDLALLTEESPDDQQRLEKDYFWCIDPLDGTLPFIESTPGYSVAIALISRTGIPNIGVIFDPVTQVLYYAIKGHGAYRNGSPWRLPSLNTTKQQALTFITDRSFSQHTQYTEVLKQLKQLCKIQGHSELKIIQQGGAVLNACWVLEQAPACYFKFPKSDLGGGGLWDFAATACLFNEINAVATDIHGQALDLNRPDSTFMNHRGVIYTNNNHLAKLITTLYNQLNKVN